MGKPCCTLKQDCMGRTSTDIYLASIAYERISNFCKNVAFIVMLHFIIPSFVLFFSDIFLFLYVGVTLVIYSSWSPECSMEQIRSRFEGYKPESVRKNIGWQVFPKQNS
ncbi:hypothetical protein VNO80_21007 [Phaseolus coccineus]|uniref:Uncharacterized protein n=1 Tax=Phaseolus coccineus TaxID=3886 RepID=A0AAN9QSN4_PHACN